MNWEHDKDVLATAEAHRNALAAFKAAEEFARAARREVERTRTAWREARTTSFAAAFHIEPGMTSIRWNHPVHGAEPLTVESVEFNRFRARALSGQTFSVPWGQSSPVDGPEWSAAGTDG